MSGLVVHQLEMLHNTFLFLILTCLFRLKWKMSTCHVCHKWTQIYSVCRPFLFQCICQPRKISGHVYVYKRYISYLFVWMRRSMKTEGEENIITTYGFINTRSYIVHKSQYWTMWTTQKWVRTPVLHNGHLLCYSYDNSIST
jgi:hypothetical protein